MDEEVRLSFLRGCALLKEPPPVEAVLKRKLKRIMDAKPENPVAYAFTAGKRWALDSMRSRQVRAKRALSDELKRVAEERHARHEACMKKELEGIINAIESVWPRYAFALRLTYFANIPAADWVQFWPGTKRDALYRIKCRARNKAAERATPELREWIGRFTET